MKSDQSLRGTPDEYFQILDLLHKAHNWGYEDGKSTEDPIPFAGDPIQMAFDTEIKQVLGLTPETKKRKCEDVHPDLQTDAHKGYHED